MRKLLSFPAILKLQIPKQRLISNLTHKNIFQVRTTKRKPDPTQQKQKEQHATQTDQSANKNDNSQQNNKDNFSQNKKQKINVHLTGPKRVIDLLRKGNTNLIPYYIKTFKNLIRNIPLPFKKQYEDSKEQGIFSNQINTNKVKQPNQQQLKPQQQKNRQFKPKYEYKSSYAYQQRLLKKYRITQALKSTRKSSYNPNHINWEQMKQLNIERIMKNNERRNYFIRVSVYAMIATVFFIYQSLNSEVTLQQPTFLNEKENQMSDGEIQNKLRQVKQIKVHTDSRNKTNLSFILNEPKKLSLVTQILQSFGFPIQPNQKISFEVQNPNIVLDGLQKVQSSTDHKQWIKIKPVQPTYNYYDAIVDTLFLATPFIGIAITYWIFTKMNPQSMMKGITSQKKSMKIQSTKDIKVRFKDVAGMENAKKQITQFVDFLKKSQKYVQMGAKIPKGALLTGPPGTGKTMLAKACAGQAGTSFFYVSGSQFVQMFVGLGASRVRQLFARARAQAPSIIFIDEIDAIGKKRQTSRNQQKDSTLNQMLVEMDGFSSSQTVIVLAATNRKDILDSALTRPGRFDRMVEISLPQLKARQQIFMVHLAPLKVNPNKPLPQLAKRLAQLTPGFSGADIANLCNQAAIIATRKKRTYIQDDDFQEASQRIMAGYVKKGLSNKKTKTRVAYHQAGHAVCGWYLRGGDPLVKLTIIPRSKGALGYAQYLPKTAYIRTKSELIDQIAIMLGGTTSQQIFLGNMSSGNSDDLQKVYGVARRMIAQFGMGSRTYNMTLDEQTYVKKESQKLCNIMDEQILEVVNQATQRAKKIIQQKRQIVQQLTKQLLQKQTINNEDILRIMGERPAFN